MKISANLGFYYSSKREFKENVSRSRSLVTNVSANLSFDYQSKCILLNFKTLKNDHVTI